jgi:hypothetical protein
MDRIVDHTKFVAEGAVVNWDEAWRKQASAAEQMHMEPPRPPKSQFDLQLRWHVSALAGVPPMPFTVWERIDKDILEPISLSLSGGGILSWGGEPLVTLEVECKPINPGAPCALYGFRRGSKTVEIIAVSEVRQGVGPFRLTIRAGSITFARLDNANVLSARAVTADDTVNKGQWKEVEFVGFPYNEGDWASLGYEGKKQGLAGNLLPPGEAGVERLKRAGPTLGWWPATETGHQAPRWDAPDSGGLIKEIQQLLLPPVGELFNGMPANQQVNHRALIDASFDSGAGQPPSVTSSQMNVPVLGTLQVATGTDPFVAIATGFGTGYPLNGDKLRSLPDYMVTATYPKGIDGQNPIEFAWVIPRPDTHMEAPAPAGMTASRAGLVAPARRNKEWRETVAVDWQALPATSLLFPRASGVAVARFDPATNDVAESLLERHDSGGWRPLAPMPRPAPHTDRIRIVDSQRLLPMDGTPLVNGYAVACQDPFGLWSKWKDVRYSSTEPPSPIPVLGEASLVATWTGSPQCSAVVEATFTLDWSVRSPSFVQLPISIFPAAFNGAPTPAGVGPFTAIAGGQQRTVTISFNGDQPQTITPGTTVSWITTQPVEDGNPIPPDPNDDRRRYRIVVTGLILNYANAGDYGAAIWARELAPVRPDWGALTPTPHRAFASSPVPVQVPFVPLPVVPLGSLPDSEGCSHVEIRTSGLGGSQTVVVWSSSETRIRQAAGVGPIPGNQSLSQRFVALKSAFRGLSNEMKRSVFSREHELAAGPASADHKLPRGSKEIYFFAATGRTRTNIDSPWPTSEDQLQAAVAPVLVSPAVPELSAAFNTAGTRIVLEMSVRSRVPVAGFEVHRTYKGPITASAAMMGPPLATVAATLATDAENPAGLRYAASFTDPAAGDWRPTYYRIVAIPALASTDHEKGRVGRRSPDSSLTSLLLPPGTPPDLTLVAADEWGTPRNGLLMRIRTSAPVEKLGAGPFTLTCRQQGTEFTTTLHEIPVASTAVPPANAAAGVFTRGNRSGGFTEIAVWFTRPNPQTTVTASLRLVDPLGRSTELTEVFAADPMVPAPVITITGSRRVAQGHIVTFTMNAPTRPDPAGVWSLTAAARRNVGTPVSGNVTVNVLDIPDVDTLPQNQPGRIVLARRTNDTNPVSPKVEYLAMVRVPRPFRIALKLTDPLGRTANADQQVP